MYFLSLCPNHLWSRLTMCNIGQRNVPQKDGIVLGRVRTQTREKDSDSGFYEGLGLGLALQSITGDPLPRVRWLGLADPSLIADEIIEGLRFGLRSSIKGLKTRTWTHAKIYSKDSGSCSSPMLKDSDLDSSLQMLDFTHHWDGWRLHDVIHFHLPES